MTINPNHEEEITSTLLKSSPPIDDSSEKPKSPFIKWFGLFLICFYVFGKSWAYDNPQALQNSLIDNMNINSEQYNWFYTIYSIPNYVLPLFSGYLVDRFGLKFGIFFFGFVVVIGQALFWLGCVLSSYGVALTGRLLFGIGGETSLLVRYCMLAQWFSNEDFGFASGATFLIQRLASTFNSLLTPKIYQSTQSLGWATFVALILCFACWFFGVIYLILSKKYSKKAKIEQENTRTEPIKKPELKQILGFHKFSYLFCTLAVIYLSVFISFTANGNSFLQKHYGFSQSQAGNVLSPLYVVAGVFTLIFGKVVDIIGKKLHFVLLGFAFEVLSMFLFIILPECSQCYIGLIPLACVGLSSALFSSGYWPTVKLLEKKEHVGMLMGLITIAYNIGEGVFPAIVGAIEDKTVADEQGYFYVLIFLGISALVGFFVMILVEFLNFKQKRGLNEIVKVES